MNAPEPVALEKTLPQAWRWRAAALARVSGLRSGLFGLREVPVLPALTGILLCLCYFPVAWGWLAWVALVPLLALVRRPARRLHVFLSTWLAGLLFFVPILQWMRVADERMYFTWLGLALYCSLYFPVTIGLVRYLDRRTRLPLVLTLPVIWTALEFVRAHLLTGFPWYFLAHTQHDTVALIQIADVTGAYGVSFLVAAVNALIFDWLCRWNWYAKFNGLPPQPSSRLPLLLQSGCVAVALLGVLGYGFWRLGQDRFEPGPRVALVQSNLPQNVRNDAAAGGDPAERMVAHNSKLSDRAAWQQPKPDLVVWPETSYPEYWIDVAADVPPETVPPEMASEASQSRSLARQVARLWPTNVLMGMNSEILEIDRRRRYNSAILIRPNGQPADRYDKIHRVPFGEYVPLRDWLPWMNQLAPYDFDYSISSGQQATRFTVGEHRFGVVICYEDSDPVLARQYVEASDAGPAVDFLVNISNDGWFKGTSEHEEHLAICRFRAVECRRAVARAVNMGVSAVIDGNGRVLQPESFHRDGDTSLWEIYGDHSDYAPALPVARWSEFKSVPGVLTATMPIDRRSSLYARYGDWLPILCWIVLLAAVAIARWQPTAYV